MPQTVKQEQLPSFGNHKFGSGKNRFAPGEKPKNAKGTLFRIISLYVRWGKTIFAAVLLTAVSSLITVAIPYYTGRSFDTFHIKTRSVDMDKLLTILTIIFCLYLANWVINSLNGWIMLRVSQKLVQVLRGDVFAKMQKIPLGFYDSHSHGDTMSRITNDVDNISSTIAQTTTQLISSILTLTGSLIIMLSLSIPLTLVVLTCVPLVAVLTRIIAGKSSVNFLAQQRHLGELNGIIEENILGFNMVKAFEKQSDAISEFSAVNENLCKASIRAQVWSGYMMPLMNVINNLIFAEVALAGGLLSIRYGMRIGIVVSFLSYSKQFTQPLNNIAGMFNSIQSALAGAERVFEILDTPEELPDIKDASEVENPVGEVEFKDVTFSYQENQPVLKNISFYVPPGKVIALVGETGAGKTTIVNLITRFYDADSGDILIDNVPISRIKRYSLRKCFSVVLQDTYLFSGTILDNIRYSRMEADREDVIEACQIAHADDFITKLPLGYDTLVNATTENLSQGQRQLIAIARAVLCDSPILILDEATSSVDTRTEKEIQKALVSLMQNRTCFLIAHRLSTIMDADLIMVIGNGGIMEQGTHRELMECRGSYYKMVMSQSGKYSPE